MRLAPGARLGPYEILAEIGAGGMGEVYRARDTRLNRTVAIKTLSPDIADDPQFQARFHREARTISQLEHPHVCALYDVGHEDGTEYLVMQYLEGETLATRLTRGSLPLSHSLQIGIEIASALDAAHRRGVAHRDLKPANVMLTASGAKLLDFGLATAAKMPFGPVTTLSTSATGGGHVLGTIHYMAPEQLDGRPTDTRADIFAFGAVIYEMLTGHRAFDGGSFATVIASVLTHEPPPVSSVRPVSPRALDYLVQRCVAKDPEERWQTVHDIRLQLEWLARKEGAPDEETVTDRAHRSPALIRLAVVGAIVAITVLGIWRLATRPSIEPSLMRFEVSPPSGSSFYALQLDLSPDGQYLALPLTTETRRTVWVRSIDSTELRELPGTENVDHPFFSPDGRHVAFFAEGRLKVADLAGGPPATIAEGVAASGGDWHGDMILFGQPPNGIFRLPASGGTPVPVTFIDTTRGDRGHAWPSILPDGRRFLYFVSNAKPEHRGIYLGSLDGAPSVMVQASASMGAYAEPGVLLFARDGTLFARAFDPDLPQQETPAVRLADGVGAHPTNGRLALAVSDRILAVRSSDPIEPRRLEWHTAEGQDLGPVGGLPTDAYQSVSLSPGGRDAVVTRVNSRGEGDILLVDLQRGVAVAAAPDLADESMPLWKPDGAAIVYSSNRDGQFALYHRTIVDGTERRIGSMAGVRLAATDWTPDGKSLLVKASKNSGAPLDIWLVPADEPTREPQLIVTGPDNQQDAELSPDGRWITYASSESGRSEVFIQAYPPTGRRWLASTSGGVEPHWSPDGNQLYFLGPGWQLVRVAVRRVPGALDLGSPLLLQVSVPAIVGLQENRYAVAADGRLLTLTSVQNRRPAPVTLVMNWRTLLPWDQRDR